MRFGFFSSSADQSESEPEVTGRTPAAVTTILLRNPDGSEYSIQAEQVTSRSTPLSEKWVPRHSREVTVYKDLQHRFILQITYRTEPDIDEHTETETAEGRTQLEDLMFLHEAEEIAIRLNAATSTRATQNVVLQDICRIWYLQITDVMEDVTEWESQGLSDDQSDC